MNWFSDSATFFYCSMLFLTIGLAILIIRLKYRSDITNEKGLEKLLRSGVEKLTVKRFRQNTYYRSKLATSTRKELPLDAAEVRSTGPNTLTDTIEILGETRNNKEVFIYSYPFDKKRLDSLLGVVQSFNSGTRSKRVSGQ